MMKKILLAVSLLFAAPVLATPQPQEFLMAQAESYRPFRYETPCALETKDGFLEDTCVVVETREPSGALRTRNIFSNRFGLTIKSRFDAEKSFVTWDSHNKFEYKFSYRVGSVNGTRPWSYVMPGVLLENVSWY